MPWGYLQYEIKFHLASEEIDKSKFTENGAWEVKESYLAVRGISQEDPNMLLVKFKLKRRWGFHLISLLLPIGAMGLLNLLVFLLPANSGERIGYSITVMLAIVVFLTIAADNLPKTSHPYISFLCLKLLIDMLISGLMVFFAIIGLRFYHADDSNTVPSCFADMTSCVLCRCCKRKKEKYKGRDDVRPEENNVPHSVNGRLPRFEVVDDRLRTKRQEDGQGFKEITWTDVGKASDVVFFVLGCMAFAASHLTYFTYIQLI